MLPLFGFSVFLLSTAVAAEAMFPNWQKEPEWVHTGSDRPYHYYGSAIWFNRIGKAMGDAMLELLKNSS